MMILHKIINTLGPIFAILFDLAICVFFSKTLKPCRAQIVCKLEAILYLNVALMVKLRKNLAFAHLKGQNRKCLAKIGSGCFKFLTQF